MHRLARRILFTSMMITAAAFAQQDEVGVGEITGFLGGVFGIGTHPAGGVTFASPTSRHIVPNVEFSYAPLGNYDFRSGPLNRTANLVRSRLYDLNAGVQVRFPTDGYMAPYIGAGIGLLRFSTDIETASAGALSRVHQANNRLAGYLSGGVRYYINDHLGIRPEVKGYLSSKNFARISVGIFWQFP